MYNPVKEEHGSESDHESSPSSEDYDSLLSHSITRKASSRRNFLLLIIGMPLIATTLVGFGIYIGSRWWMNPNDFCPRHVQSYSPILEEVDTSLHTVVFNGSLLKENVFRLTAGPEVDAAWESLGVGYRSLAVPLNEAAESGLKADQVKINEKYGGGFPANVEGLHHLHCLNLVRQSLYYNYDYYKAGGKGAFKNDDNIVKHHVSHCLDIIRQQLMCQPDTGLLGQVWWNEEMPTAFVDFNTKHKCKNFDAIRKWAEERQIPEQVPVDFLQPPKKGDLIYKAIPR